MEIQTVKNISQSCSNLLQKYRGRPEKGDINEEIEFVLSLNLKLNFIKSDEKSDAAAKLLKEEGNKNYKLKSFQAALLSYSRGIRMANDEILKGELFSNRSIIFDVTKEYESCYADCQAAIYYKYGADKPDRLKKLVERMNRSEAKIQIEEIKKNNNFHLHESLELKNSSEKGLHVKTKKKIMKNEILLVEESQGFAPIIEDEFQSFCFYCLAERRHKYQFICCDGCPLNLYCSFKCRDLDSENHKLECGYSRMLNSAGISYLVYKLITKRQSFLKEESCKNRTNFPIGSNGTQFEFNFFQIQPNSLRMFTLLSYHLISFLQHKNVLSFDKTSLERCIETIYIAQMNSSVIFHSDSQPVAAALFSNLSLLNHSCQPNIRIEHDGVHVKVFARRDIKQDEEIFNSYIDTEMPFETRQDLLEGQYEFICDCQKCLRRI